MLAKELSAKSEIGLKSKTLAAVIFNLYTMHKFAKAKKAEETRSHIQHLVDNDFEINENKAELYNKLQSIKEGEVPLVIESQTSFMKRVGIKSRSRWLIYLESDVLGLTTYYLQHKIKDAKSDKDFLTKRIVFNIKQLKEQVDHYLEEIKFDWKKEDYLCSGFTTQSERFVNDIAIRYEEVFSRDKTSYMSYNPLIKNPFLRVERIDNEVNVYGQLNFMGFEYVLASLYKENESKFKDSFPTKVLDKDIKKIILGVRNENLIVFLKDQLKGKLSNGILKLYPHVGDTEHFNQIRAVKKTITKVSENGIMIDISEAIKLREEVEVEIEQLGVFEDSENSTEEVSDEEEEYEESKDYIRDIDAETFKKLKNRRTLLTKYIASRYSLKNIDSDKVRLYGKFVPHGASTHRMTCRLFNLQGISSEIRERIYTAPKGRMLLSADVSSQDIAVAANMARKLFEKIKFTAIDSDRKVEKHLYNINDTLEKLKRSEENSNSNLWRPVDFITQQITSIADTKSKEYQAMKKLVKSSVYISLYGGGKSTIEKKVGGESIAKLKKRLEESMSEFKDAVINNARSDSHEDSLSEKIDLNRLKASYLRSILTKAEEAGSVFDRTQDILKEHYPGIVESFDYYKKYYDENGLTFPTFLGWQTNVSLPYNPGHISTRAKAYPIQASGAELIREWLIQLMQISVSGSTYKIVNVVHDQLIIEVLDKDCWPERAGTNLNRSLKFAAGRLGMASGTINIPRIEQLYPPLEDTELNRG